MVVTPFPITEISAKKLRATKNKNLLKWYWGSRWEKRQI